MHRSGQPSLFLYGNEVLALHGYRHFIPPQINGIRSSWITELRAFESCEVGQGRCNWRCGNHNRYVFSDPLHFIIADTTSFKCSPVCGSARRWLLLLRRLRLSEELCHKAMRSSRVFSCNLLVGVTRRTEERTLLQHSTLIKVVIWVE